MPFIFPAPTVSLPAWTLLCWASEARKPNVFPQTSHLYGFAPMWHRLWHFRYSLVAKCFPHISHLKRRSPEKKGKGTLNSRSSLRPKLPPGSELYRVPFCMFNFLMLFTQFKYFSPQNHLFHNFKLLFIWVPCGSVYPLILSLALCVGSPLGPRSLTQPLITLSAHKTPTPRHHPQFSTSKLVFVCLSTPVSSFPVLEVSSLS